ncbi:hypothetical protein [Egicoccus sp. AB-alg6-2]
MLATSTSVGVATQLAHTGLSMGWLLVTAAALLTVGVVTLRLVPRDEF